MTSSFVTHQAKTLKWLMPCQHYQQRVMNPSPKWTSKPTWFSLSLQKIKEESNLEAKLGALKEMISEGWLTHIQQHPTLLKPNWPFRDQIASEDGIFTKAHRIIIPSTLQKYIFAKLHRPHKVQRRIKLRAKVLIYVLFYMSSTKKIVFIAVLSWFLLFGKI